MPLFAIPPECLPAASSLAVNNVLFLISLRACFSVQCKELALFLTAGIVISAYGLPIILARSPDPEAVVSLSRRPKAHRQIKLSFLRLSCRSVGEPAFSLSAGTASFF